jgi:glycosyltransferase involved in cell wall biosynthesis
MNILRIAYEWPPPWDGLAAAPYEMTSAQARLGHKIDVLCGRWPMSGDIEHVSGVTVHPLIREPLRGTLAITISPVLFLYYLFLRRKWRKQGKVIDVIHSHGHFAIWIYWYRNFLKKRFPKAKELETPLVAHFHNTVKGRAEGLKKNGTNVAFISQYISWPFAERSDRWAVAAASACVFVSGDIRKDAIKYYGADPKKCFVVETGVNTTLFSAVGPEEKLKTRRDLGIFPTDKVILNHGVMLERKNIHMLIESLEFLPAEYKLLLVGPTTNPEYGLRLKEITDSKKLEHRVIRVGYTPYPQVPIAFQAADVFVLPSAWEGLPKVVMQSLACRVPVLASGFKAKHEISGLLYLDELTPENIAEQIKHVVATKPIVDINSVQSLYSWNVMARKVDQVYTRIIKSS